MMGVVVSVNVGLPQDVAWQGRTVRTGIWKKPVTGRIFRWRRPRGPRRPWRRATCAHGLPARILPLLGEPPWAVGSRAWDFRREPHLEFGHFRSRRGYRPKISATNAAGSV